MEVQGGKKALKWICEGEMKKWTLLWENAVSRELLESQESIQNRYDQKSKHVFNHIRLSKSYRNDNEKVIQTWLVVRRNLKDSRLKVFNHSQDRNC